MARGAPDYNQSVIAGGGILTDGWQDFPDVATYVNANQFDIPGDLSESSANPVFSVGAKIKLIQGITTKFFYVTDSTFGGVNTRVTAYAGASFSLINAAIATPKINYNEVAPGFPDWFSLVGLGTWGGGAPMTVTVTTTRAHKFILKGRQVTLTCAVVVTTGVGGNQIILFTPPTQLRPLVGEGTVLGSPACAFVYDEAIGQPSQPGVGHIDPTNLSILLIKIGYVNWAIRVGTIICFTAIYPIN
jgi:hypothetical protein